MPQFNSEVGKKLEKTENSTDKKSSFSHGLMTASCLARAGAFADPALAQVTNDPYDEIIITATKSGAQNLPDIDSHHRTFVRIYRRDWSRFMAYQA